LLKPGENLLCDLGTTWKDTFTVTAFLVIVSVQNFKSRIITEQICQNFYTLITEEPVAFLDIRAHHWEIYSDISKKHTSFIFKGFECPEDYSRASRILKHTAMKPQVSSFILSANTGTDFYASHKTNNEMKKTSSMVYLEPV
jgi:hypothetical protein